MAFDTRITYLCYNNRDLIRDGFIPNVIRKSYREDNSLTNPVTTFNFNRLKDPPKGVTYTLKRKDDDPNVIVEVIEKKKLLPAEKIKVEIDFSKTMKNAITHPVGVSPIAPGIAGGIVGNAGMEAVGFGGFSTGITEMTYHILESSTKINQSVSITQEMLDTGIIKFDGYPLSIFGIVKEHVEEFESDSGEDGKTDREKAAEFKVDHPQARIETVNGKVVAKIGLDFKVIDDFNQLDSLGKFSQGSFLETGRKRIDGATDSNGLFGGRASPYLILVEKEGDSDIDDAEDRAKREVVFFSDQKQLLVKIVQDERTLKFRGDNHEALGGGRYPFSIRGIPGIDVTDDQIRIDITDLVVGDVIYITYNSTVGDRHLRQNLDHKGVIVQGNTIGIVGFRVAVSSDQDAYDYKIRTWKVPPLPDGITIPIIDQVTDGYTQDSDYKLPINDFLTIDAKQREDENFVLTGQEASEIEGWRLSEAILWRTIRNLFAADYRGILHLQNRTDVTVLYPRSEIRDQDWFTTYLESLPFTYPTGPVDPDDTVDENGDSKLTYLPSDLEKKIEKEINFEDEAGYLFDTAEIVNSLLFDREKLHYYRPFADALKTVSKYETDKSETGIGIYNLDLLPLFCSSVITTTETEVINGETVTRSKHSYDNFYLSSCGVINLEYYDLSYGVFDNAHAQFAKSRSCEESFPLRSYNYFSTNRDADSDGQGIWYDRGTIENNVMEWRPEGGTILSHWKIETPYFCGDFNNSSRVYIEKMGGNALDNYSWIYVDTDPFIPNNISADANYDASTSIVVFEEEKVHNGLSYNLMNDNIFEAQSPLKKIDKTKNHVRDTYEHVVDGETVTEAYDHAKNMLSGQNRILGDFPSFSYGSPIINESMDVDPSDFSFIKDLLTDTWDDGTSFDLDFSDIPPRANISFNWNINSIEIDFSYTAEKVSNIEKYVSFYFEDTESSISELLMIEDNPINNGFFVKFNLKYYHGGPMQFLGDFWGKVNINSIKAEFVKGIDASIEDSLNIDTYKIKSGQSSVSYDGQGRIFVFYANEETGNIDVAVSYDDGDTWAYDKNIIRLTSSELATMPFAIKDTNSIDIHLFWVLNDKFLMYRKINTDYIDVSNGSVTPVIPETYQAGDYDLTFDDPEKEYWGNFTYDGMLLRRETSYFVVADSDDEYFIEQSEINTQINSLNETLIDTVNKDKAQSNRFVSDSDSSEMRNNFNSLPYSAYLADDGVLRLFFVSNNKLSVKSSYDNTAWQYDVVEQSIHKDYMNEELNKGLSEDISNIQIVRDDYSKSVVSVLYFHNNMLFIRHFQTNLLFTWRDSKGNLHDDQMRNHLEVTDEDSTVDPPKKRTENVPIFLVGVIPDSIKNSIKKDIDNNVSIENSDLAIYFPYKDPDTPGNKDANKAMVDIFNENFAVNIDTQPYAYVTAKGLIRVFYKDSVGNVDGIIIDALFYPNLEVMNVFKDGE